VRSDARREGRRGDLVRGSELARASIEDDDDDDNSASLRTESNTEITEPPAFRKPLKPRFVENRLLEIKIKFEKF
jgi:hypothetical protein